MNIHDIPIDDIEVFLEKNDIDVQYIDDDEIYDIALKLMKNNKTSYKNVPKSIIEWMMAYNFVKKEIDIPKYSIYEIRNLSDQELDYLTKKLGMKTKNIESIINILKYSGNLLQINISDIPRKDIEIFLKENNKDISSKSFYDDAFRLMRDNNTSYKNVPYSIIEWMMAYNVLKRGIYIPLYSIFEIGRLHEDDIRELNKKLTGYERHGDINNIKNILKYLGKLSGYYNLSPTIINEYNRHNNFYNFYILQNNNIRFDIDYKDKNFLDSLEKELLKVNREKILINGLEYYDLKVGDRVFSYDYDNPNREQFVVLSINNNEADLQRVDVLGNSISNQIDSAFRWSDGWKSVWGKLYPGILLFDNGPEIKDLNSPYLKYKVLSLREKEIPELNMTVTIYDHTERKTKLYYIKELKYNYMILESIDSDKIHRIEVIKKDNRWQLDDFYINDYKLGRIGGFIHMGS